MTRSLRSALRRVCGLLLAIGLVPAASGGAVCWSHWGADARLSVSPSAHAHVTHALPAHDHRAARAHEHHADAPSPAAPASDAPSHESAAPCSALATCGTAAAPESPRALAARPLPYAAVRVAEHTLPRGPAHDPDVPPPRR